jgi:hypothetical protein
MCASLSKTGVSGSHTAPVRPRGVWRRQNAYATFCGVASNAPPKVASNARPKDYQ